MNYTAQTQANLALNGIETGVSVVPLNIIRIITVVVVIIFRKEQPLRARWPSPLFMLVMHILATILLNLYQWVIVPGTSAYNALTGSFLVSFSFAIYVILVYAICFLFFRFTLVSNLNRLRLFQADVNNNYVLSEWKFKIYKLLTSRVTLISTTVILFVIESAIAVLFSLLGYYNVISFLTGQLIVEIQACVVMLLLVFISAGMLLWGIIMEAKETGIHGFFSDAHDPLCFRKDALISLLTIPFLLITIIAQILLLLPGLNLSLGVFAVLILITRGSYYFVLIFVIFISGMTCIVSIAVRKLRGPQVNKGSEESVLIQLLNKNGEARRLFEKYCGREYCSENILAYCDVERYENLTNDFDRYEFATTMMNMYMKSGSVNEVNTTEDVIKNVQRVLDQGHESKELDGLMTQFGVELIQNMSDTFFRFSNTSEYGLIVKQDEIQKIMLAEHNLD
jgi:hypothetical protein